MDASLPDALLSSGPLLSLSLRSLTGRRRGGVVASLRRCWSSVICRRRLPLWTSLLARGGPGLTWAPLSSCLSSSSTLRSEKEELRSLRSHVFSESESLLLVMIAATTSIWRPSTPDDAAAAAALCRARITVFGPMGGGRFATIGVPHVTVRLMDGRCCASGDAVDGDGCRRLLSMAEEDEDDGPALLSPVDASAARVVARSGLTSGLTSPGSTTHSMSSVSDARASPIQSGSRGRCASDA